MVKQTPKAEEDLERIVAHVSKNFCFEIGLQTLVSVIKFAETRYKI